MKPVQQPPHTPSLKPEVPDSPARNSAALPTWRLDVMRVGYFVMGHPLAPLASQFALARGDRGR